MRSKVTISDLQQILERVEQEAELRDITINNYATESSVIIDQVDDNSTLQRTVYTVR